MTVVLVFRKRNNPPLPAASGRTLGVLARADANELANFALDLTADAEACGDLLLTRLDASIARRAVRGANRRS